MQTDDWTVADHLRDRPAAAVTLFHEFVALVSACGPFVYSPAKTTVTFKGARRGFAGARPTAGGMLLGYLDLQREVTDRRVTGVSPYTTRLFVHRFRITDPAELDETFAGWVQEAYAVGAGEHLLA